MNKVVLVGRMTKKPELRTSASGTNVCSFTVACDRKFLENGERKADFINCVAWKQSGEAIAKHFDKGHRIALDGRLQVRTWTGNDGKTNYTTEVIVENWEFAQSRNETQPTHAAQQNFTAPQTFTAPTETYGGIEGFVPIMDEDIPF